MHFQKVAHLFSLLKHSKIQSISTTETLSQNIQLDIKRDDLIHPIISGNKWRKLKYLLLEVEAKGYKKIAVMGGQYSNLLHTLSYISMLLGWQVELYVRAHKGQKLTPMLHDAIRWGAKIQNVDRATFREYRESKPNLEDDTYWISEGAFDQLAVKGSIESLMELNEQYDYLLIACATGTSLAGYCAGVSRLALTTKVVGVSVLKNDDEIERHVALLAGGDEKPIVINDYDFGGYAKRNDQLLRFISQFESEQGIPLEPVYNGKSFYAAMDLIKQGYFLEGSKILLIHCGGMQGAR